MISCSATPRLLASAQQGSKELLDREGGRAPAEFIRLKAALAARATFRVVERDGLGGELVGHGGSPGAARSPFAEADAALAELRDRADAILDMHAEATSEKVAMAGYWTAGSRPASARTPTSPRRMPACLGGDGQHHRRRHDRAEAWRGHRCGSGSWRGALPR